MSAARVSRLRRLAGRRSQDTTIRVQAARGAFQAYKPQTQNRGLRYPLPAAPLGWTNYELEDLVTVGKEFRIEPPSIAISAFNDELRFDYVADIP